MLKTYSDLRTSLKTGEQTRLAQRRFVQATSRVLVGTGIMAVSIGAVLAGVITASGDDDDDKLKALLGQENYAINVNAFFRWITGGDTTPQNGDLYVTYSNYEPLSSMIAAGAEIGISMKEGKDPVETAGNALTAWVNTIMELSTLNNVSTLFEYGNFRWSIG